MHDGRCHVQPGWWSQGKVIGLCVLTHGAAPAGTRRTCLTACCPSWGSSPRRAALTSTATAASTLRTSERAPRCRADPGAVQQHVTALRGLKAKSPCVAAWWTVAVPSVRLRRCAPAIASRDLVGCTRRILPGRACTGCSHRRRRTSRRSTSPSRWPASTGAAAAPHRTAWHSTSLMSQLTHHLTIP